jgi:hypothetical protein
MVNPSRRQLIEVAQARAPHAFREGR